MMRKQQILVIHGGDSFKSRQAYLKALKEWRIDFDRYIKPKTGWKAGLQNKLGQSYEVILADMPNKMDAKYEEWKIWFEKFTPHIRPEVILIGHSLGALFLAKYLSENRYKRTIKAVFLVAPPFGAGDFTLIRNLSRLSSQAGKLFIYHSKDDPYVSFKDHDKFIKTIDGAESKVFNNKGHFNQSQFPELVREIKSL